MTFVRCLLLLTACLAWMSPALAQEAAAPPEVHLDVDIGVPRMRVRPPVSETTLKIYEALPARLYFNASSEASLRLETNPYQAPRDNDPFTESTNVFRSQTDVTVGYALTPKTRVSGSYFLLRDQYNDFTPYHLDSTANSFALNVEHDFYQGKKWLIRGATTARQVVLRNAPDTGDLLPSVTAMRSLGSNGWLYGNAALDLNYDDFVFDDLERLSGIFTVGTGYQVPWQPTRKGMRPLKGIQFNLSSTYSLNGEMRQPQFGYPWNSQSIIVTSEISRKVRRTWPLSLFVRNEVVFNFGQETPVFGLSGVNYRLFGGTRLSTGKSPVFTQNLAQQSGGTR